MRKLVGIDIPLSAEFVAALLDIWNAGDCAFPIDQRLAQKQKVQLVEEFCVDDLVTTEGRSVLGAQGSTITENDAVLFTTSGSSGTPKGVIHTHDSLRANADSVAQYFGNT
jgi:acyl-CoA synthetase (AMP-forming)/AMP-acid ligase II